MTHKSALVHSSVGCFASFLFALANLRHASSFAPGAHIPRPELINSLHPPNRFQVSSVPVHRARVPCTSTRLHENKLAQKSQERKEKQTTFLQHVRNIVKSSLVGARLAIRYQWWCTPFLFCIYPFFYFLLVGKPAVSPSFWSMPMLDSLVHSPSAGVIISGFLLSNISYFLSGLYLLDLIPVVRWAMPSKRKLMEKSEPGRGFSENPLLGTMVILCGVCSVFYHVFQTLGPTHVAETLFYIDHGFAISTILYFINLCGVPSRKTLAIGSCGLIMLASGSLRGAEAYAWIHSMWHFFSAGASVSWAHDGLKKLEADDSRE